MIHPTSIAVSREHRRAKTDRLDLELLQRAFLGWLRGEKKHCSMAPIPSMAEEDARRLNRERQTLTGEASRIVNRMKASLARLGIGNFNVKLADAAARLEALRTGEGAAVPPLMRAELHRAMARLALIRAQIKEIDVARQERLRQAPAAYRRRCGALNRVYGLGAATADMLSVEVFSRPLRDRRAWPAEPVLGPQAGPGGRADRRPGRERQEAARERARQACPWQEQRPAMPGCVTA